MTFVVVAAPASYKGTLSALQAASLMCAAAEEGAGAKAISAAMADGGHGSLEIIRRTSKNCKLELVPTQDHLGRRITAPILWLDKSRVFLESAQNFSSIKLEPLLATSFGVGLLIAHAVKQGAKEVMVGVGGTASTDGGAGMLQALGAKLLDGSAQELSRGGSALALLERVDLQPALELLGATQLRAAVDVNNPLLGMEGAARNFAPQKGAGPTDVTVLEQSLAHFVDVLGAQHSAAIFGAGAGGGLGCGLALLGAELIPGAQVVADLIGLDEKISECDLVLTGEGQLDATTARGKAPYEVALRAKRQGKPCVALVGKATAESGLFDEVIAFGDDASASDLLRTTTLLGVVVREAVLSYQARR